jgi:hypothetical protein
MVPATLRWFCSAEQKRTCWVTCVFPALALVLTFVADLPPRDGHDPRDGDIFDSRAVARVDPHAVNVDRPGGVSGGDALSRLGLRASLEGEEASGGGA